MRAQSDSVPPEFDALSNRVIGCAIEVHRELGPGLLESAYARCLRHELGLNGIGFEFERELPVKYKGIHLDCGYRIDLYFEGSLIVELKSVAAIEPIAALIENGGTVNLGHRAGLYRRVIWVVPAAGPVTSATLDEFRRIMAERRGYPEAALADFSATGEWFVGTIDGIPLTVTALENLDVGRERAVLNIDLSYFVGRQAEDPAYRPGTASLLEFLRFLKTRRIAAECVTVNLASLRQAVPMDIRYYGEIISEALENPALLADPPPAVYALMIEAERELVAGKFGEAEARYAELTRRRGDSAGLFFSLAVARGFDGRAEGCREALLEAYRLDPAYLRGFFQLARVLGGANKVEAGEYLLETPDLVKVIPAIEMDLQRGMFYFGAGDYHNAIIFLESVASQRRDDFAVRTVLLRAYEEVGATGKAAAVLEALIEIDAGRVDRDMPWVYKRLGRLTEEAGLGARAAEAYARYLELVPGDEDAESMSRVIERYGR